MAIRVPFHSLAQWFQQIPCAERAGNFGAAAGNFFCGDREEFRFTGNRSR
jgi:hypothetical protein